MQDTFLSVIQKIDTFRGDSAFASWLYRIAANAAYEHLRPRRRRRADISLDSLLPVFDGYGQHAVHGGGEMECARRLLQPVLATLAAEHTLFR